LYEVVFSDLMITVIVADKMEAPEGRGDFDAVWGQ
jgi:hypothetical protein